MPNDQYAVEFTRAAEKDLKALRGNAAIAVRAILKLENNPELGQILSGSLHGYRALEFTVKGSGAFRALYSIDSVQRVCAVFIVGPHEGIYARAERRSKSVPPKQ